MLIRVYIRRMATVDSRMVGPVAALLLFLAVSNGVDALECPSGNLRFSNEELGKMNTEKLNEKMDQFKVCRTL